MKKKICIIGGGPCGMRMAENLSKEDTHIILVERETKLGGCWKVEWKRSYFTEHSPRVLSTGYKTFFKKIKPYNLETVPVYNSTATENKLMFTNFIYNNLSYFDMFKFLYGITFYNENDDRTVQEWLDDKNISVKGKNGIRKLCIVLATIPENLSWVALCDSIRKDTGGLIVNLKSSDYWIKKYENELSKKCSIYKSSEITKINYKNTKVTSITTSKGDNIRADLFIFCIPVYQLWTLFKKNKISLSDWTYDDVLKSSYSSIGFQLHFTKKQKFPEKWCTSCTGDWSIIMLNTSKYFEHFSRNPNIKDVYSFTIIDTFTKSKYINKSVNDLDSIDSIISEALRQLKESLQVKILPIEITVTKGLKKIKGVWQSKDTGFAITPKGTIDQETDFDNMFTVGPHNLDKISVLESAFESADLFYERIKHIF